ncbi:MAG TPA: carbonic anhydrase [Trebonia sp.]|nr:carbonic anhydrase [Trebonia sp.]
MTRMTPLIERNERFAATHAPAALAPPTAQVVIVSCLDHRIPPELILALEPGEAPVIRNAGGRVTPAVIDDLAYLAFLAEQLFSPQDAPGSLFEVAVIHHTQCGTGFLADPGFLRRAARATGLSEATLRHSAVDDPHATVRADVERLLAADRIPQKVSVSGHVHDIATGRITTVLGARHPVRAGAGPG